MLKQSPVSIKMLNRLTKYLNYLKELPSRGQVNVSAATIAEDLDLNAVQVRKDLAQVSSRGRPKTGYVTKELIADIEHYLGYDNCTDSVLIGVGNLGKALLSYENFARYGLNIVAAFDQAPRLIGTKVGDREILDAAKLGNLCKRLQVRIGIITVPAPAAQDVCDVLIAGGIRAIWNFAPVNLKVPENVAVKNEDMAASLAILTKQLAESLDKYGSD